MYNEYKTITIKENKKWKVEKQMKRTKQNGITLIALVITIALNCLRSGRKLEYTA